MMTDILIIRELFEAEGFGAYVPVEKTVLKNSNTVQRRHPHGYHDAAYGWMGQSARSSLKD
jgi:hypothetical protein